MSDYSQTSAIFAGVAMFIGLVIASIAWKTFIPVLVVIVPASIWFFSSGLEMLKQPKYDEDEVGGRIGLGLVLAIVSLACIGLQFESVTAVFVSLFAISGILAYNALRPDDADPLFSISFCWSEDREDDEDDEDEDSGSSCKSSRGSNRGGNGKRNGRNGQKSTRKSAKEAMNQG